MISRRQLVVLAVLAALAVLVLAVGLAAGARDDGTDGGWRERLSGRAGGAPLEPADLRRVEGDCPRTEDGFAVPAGCVLELASSGGRLSIGSGVRRGRLTVAAGTVLVEVTVEGKTANNTMNPDESADVTIGRNGGRISLRCLGGAGCTVRLAPAD